MSVGDTSFLSPPLSDSDVGESQDQVCVSHSSSKAKTDFEIRFRIPSKPCGCMQDYDFLTLLATGEFSQIALVMNKRTEKVRVMKLIEKVLLSTNKFREANINSELRIIQAVNCSFIVGSIDYFMDNVYICIVMQFLNGGDMFTHIRKNGTFPEDQAQFYASQVILAFEYLHKLGVIHRDLKPENMLMDMHGYIRLTDFGFSKKIDNHRTYTLCGTPEYIAPEILLHQGYGCSVDWWALGILIYEMNAGYPPFFAQEHIRLYERIVAGKYHVPKHFSRELKDLLKNMLEVDKTKRYGNLKRGIRDIKGHEWFLDVDFDKVFNKQVPAQYIPELDSEIDTRYFHPKDSLNLRKSSKNECEDTFKNMF